MGETIQQMIADVIKREGGFVDDDADKGGATNMGITQATLSAWLKRSATVDDVRALTAGQAAAIYAQMFFTAPHIDKLPTAIQPVCFDLCVNSSPTTMGRLVQQTLNDAGFGPLATDGVLGPQSQAAAAAAVAKMGGPAVVDALVAARDRFLQAIVQNDPATAAACKVLGLTLDAALVQQMATDKALVARILAAAPKSQAKFLAGWLARSDSFRQVTATA
ncbi:MAG: glycoside hydrolase family 108 protein [Actinomycetota bacterium]